MASEEGSQTMVEPSCTKEIMKLPIVEWACSKISYFYMKTKNSNRTVNKVLHSIECMSDKVVKVASPLVSKLRKPLNFINGFVYGALCWLENRVPVIKEPFQKVLNYLKKNAGSLVKPFSKLGSLLVNTPAFLLEQISKLPVLPLKAIRSVENFVDKMFPIKPANKLKCESDASSEQSSRDGDVSPALGTNLVNTAESIGRLGFKLIRAGFLVSTAPFRWSYSLLSFSCVPPELVADEVIVYSGVECGESSTAFTDLKRKTVISSKSD